MRLPSHTKSKKGTFTFIPWFSKHTAQAIYPNIYLPKKVYENLKTQNPKLEYIAVLAHEERHIKRQKEEGFLKWLVKYLFNPKFRFNEELIAIKAQAEIYKKHNKRFDTEKAAKTLSGWLYFWPIARSVAKRELENICN